MSTPGLNGGQQEAPAGWYAWFKSAVKKLKRQVLAVHYAMEDPRTPWYAKVIAVLVLAYALSPLDLIPDFIPILGLVDDLLLLPAMILLAIWMIPTEVMADAHERAAHEPLQLSKNWLTACLIAALWILGIEWLAVLVIQHYGNGWWRHNMWHLVGWSSYGMAVAFLLWLLHILQQEARKQGRLQEALLQQHV